MQYFYLKMLSPNLLDNDKKPCWIYVDGQSLNSFKDSMTKMRSKDLLDKEESLRNILYSIIVEESYPDDLMISAIKDLNIVDSIEIKKLLYIFWEVIGKTDKSKPGQLRSEFLLVCNALRKDLTSHNEYVRGRSLRLVSKLPYFDLYESVKSAVFENLVHKHPYVRKNALNCIMSIYRNFGSDSFPNDIYDKLKEIIEKDPDINTRRNAYIVLSKLDLDESLSITKSLLAKSEITELGDLFILSIVENVRHLAKEFPKEKMRLIKMLIDLSSHKSPSVLFEIATSLIQISSNQNIVRHTINILSNLLIEIKDNNTLTIILRKLIELKDKYRSILEENILTYAMILNQNATSELRKLILTIVSDLINQNNINSVFEILIKHFNKLKQMADNSSVIEFKNMLLDCIYTNIKKFPYIKRTYPLFVLEKCLLYDSQGTFIDNQTTVINELFTLYANLQKSENLADTSINIDDKVSLKELIMKLLQNFEDITHPQISLTSLFILSEYVEDLDLLRNSFDLILKNLGNLDFEELKSTNNEPNDKEESGKKIVTKTVILEDGTYGTKTTMLEAYEVSKKDKLRLRDFLLNTNFFFATNLCVCLTKISFKIFKMDSTRECYNSYFYNVISVLCAILKIDSSKIHKDEDGVMRINMCLEFLLENDYDNFTNWNEESKKIFLVNQLTKQSESKVNKKHFTNPDDFISFRQVMPFDPEQIGLIEEENNYQDLENLLEDSNTASQRKFVETLTGSEDALQIEASIEIFTFDIVLEFYIKNKLKNELHNVSIDLYAPTNLEIIEKVPQINLKQGEIRVVRSCIKFSTTCNSFIFGNASYVNNKGQTISINLSGIYINLLNTYVEQCSENNFRKCWIEYNWEHKVIIISKSQYFNDIIDTIVKELHLNMVVPKSTDLIDEESGFLVCNMYAKSKLGEDALINVSIEKCNDNKIIGSAIIRSKVKEFAQFLGDRIKSLVK